MDWSRSGSQHFRQRFPRAVWLCGDSDIFGQPRVLSASKVNICGIAACGKNHRFCTSVPAAAITPSLMKDGIAFPGPSQA